MVYSIGPSLVNYLFKNSEKSSVMDYFATKARGGAISRLSDSTHSSTADTNNIQSQSGGYKKVDLATIDGLTKNKDKLAVVAQALTNVSTQMKAISQTGIYSRGAALAGETEKIAQAVATIADKVDADTVSKADKTAMENVLNALNIIQQNLAPMQNKVPSSKALELRDAVQATVTTIRELAEKFEFTIKTSKTVETAPVTDPTKLVDVIA